MYKVEIDISMWDKDEKIIIHTNDFEKVQILQEFIEAQNDSGWSGEFLGFEGDEAEDEEEEEEDEGDEPRTVSTLIIRSESY